jgi:RNA polymerase sigma factor (sigma-70 family)
MDYARDTGVHAGVWSKPGAMTDQSMIDQLMGHVAGLRRYAFALTGAQPEAEDLVQETLVRAIAAAGSFRADGNLRGWLFSIMHNAYISGARRRAPLTVALEDDVASAAPPTQLLQLEVRDVLGALARLPEAQRAALSLIALEEFSYEEAARVLEIPLGTLMSRLARGRETLRQVMAAERRPVLQVVGEPGLGAKR